MYTSTCVHLVVHERIKRAKMIKQTSIPPLDPNPSSQPPVKSTKQDKLAGPSRYSKHSSTSKTRRVRRSENTSLYCRPFDPPCRDPSERPRIFHISSWKKLGEKSGVTGWIEAKKTPPKWKKCSTVTGVNRRPPPPSCEDTSDTLGVGGRAVGPPFSLEPRDGTSGLWHVRSCTCQSWGYGFRFPLGHRKRRGAIMF